MAGSPREPLVALVPIDHELAEKTSVALTDLKDISFVLSEEGFALNRIIRDACRRHGFDPEVAAQSSQLDFLIELVAAGLGVAFLPRMIAKQRRHPAIEYLLLAEPQLGWNVAMVWRRGAYLSHAANAWLSIVCESRSDDILKST